MRHALQCKNIENTFFFFNKRTNRWMKRNLICLSRKSDDKFMVVIGCYHRMMMIVIVSNYVKNSRSISILFMNIRCKCAKIYRSNHKWPFHLTSKVYLNLTCSACQIEKLSIYKIVNCSFPHTFWPKMIYQNTAWVHSLRIVLQHQL